MWIARQDAARPRPTGSRQIAKKLKNPAIGITYEWQREYPNRTLAGPVVGFRLIDGRGGGGLERSMNDRLSAAGRQEQ